MANVEEKKDDVVIEDETQVEDKPDDSKETETKKEERTFTQEEVNRMMAREKKQGRAALLKELGYKDEKSAMSASKSYNAWLEAQKSEEQKAADKEIKDNEALLEAQAKANEAEAKVEALMLGCKPGNVDDVIALAMAKKTDDGDFKTIIGEIKKKYPDMFNKSSDGEEDDKDEKEKTKGQKGTGGNVSSKSKEKKDESEKSLGSRLAASRRKNKTDAKKSYWS